MADENLFVHKDENEEKAPETDKLIVIMLLSTFFMAILIMGVTFRAAPDFETPEYKSMAKEAPEISTFQLSDSENEAVFPININTATYQELQTIPGIGPATARMIITFREQNGTIVEFDELLSVNGIGKKTVELIAEYCYIG